MNCFTEEETYLELEHTLHQRPPIVNVRAMLLNGADEGWYIDAQGTQILLSRIIMNLNSYFLKSHNILM